MIVCICHAITQTEVESQIAAGASTELEIGERCRAGTDCGGCVEKICAILSRTRPECDTVTLAVA